MTGSSPAYVYYEYAAGSDSCESGPGPYIAVSPAYFLDIFSHQYFFFGMEKSKNISSSTRSCEDSLSELSEGSNLKNEEEKISTWKKIWDSMSTLSKQNQDVTADQPQKSSLLNHLSHLSQRYPRVLMRLCRNGRFISQQLSLSRSLRV